MPGVVYLPPDNRWSQVGQGLGGLLGNIVSNMYNTQVQSGVSQIMSDPQYKDNPTQMLSAVSQKYGPNGVKALTTLLDNQAKIAQIGLVGAETEKTKAGVPLTQAETAHAQAQTAATTQNTQIQAAEEPADLAEKINRARLTGTQADTSQQLLAAGMPAQQVAGEAANVRMKEAQATEAETNVELTNQVLQQNKYLFGVPGDTSNNPNSKTGLDIMLDQAGITDAQQRARVKNAALLGGKNAMTAARQEMDKVAEQNAIVNRQAVAPTDVRKHLADGSAMYDNLTPFLNASQDALGVVGGIKGWLAKKGLMSDPDVVSQVTAGEQAMANFARSGSGFGGAWLTRLASDTNPSINHNAMYNVKLTGQIAQQQIAKYQAEYDSLKGVPAQANILPEIQKRIDQYKTMLDTANTLWWGYDQNTQDGNGGAGKLHMFYKGQEVDDKTLQPLPQAQQSILPPDASVKAKNGQTFTGAMINDIARKAGVPPKSVELYFEGQGPNPVMSPR